jgi:hypothetical protein
VGKAIYGEDGGEKLLDFLRHSTIPHEQIFCFYLRKGVRHFETWTNSGHEGTNNAIKSGPSRVLPQHAIDKSAKIQVDSDLLKFDLYRRQVAAKLLGRAIWSLSQTVNHITLPADYMLKFAVRECESYASWRISKQKWLVIRSVERDAQSLIPRFHRVYTISLLPLDGDSCCLTCDCECFECNGIVCQRLVHVKKYYYGAQSEITHHDLAVRWWKAYLYFATKNMQDCSTTERDIKWELEKLRGNDCKWPMFTDKEEDQNVPVNPNLPRP